MPRTCTIDSCGSNHYGHGYCNAHYKKWRRYGNPLHDARQPATACTVPSCDHDGPIRRGYCIKHYRRWKRHGDPLAGGTERGLTPADRFWPKVDKTDDCWLWTGSLKPDGYGMFKVGTKTVLAHRFAYELEVGPIPDGLEIDHLCRVRACVRVDHLEVVTRDENMRRAALAQEE